MKNYIQFSSDEHYVPREELKNILESQRSEFNLPDEQGNWFSRFRNCFSLKFQTDSLLIERKNRILEIWRKNLEADPACNPLKTEADYKKFLIGSFKEVITHLRLKNGKTKLRSAVSSTINIAPFCLPGKETCRYLYQTGEEAFNTILSESKPMYYHISDSELALFRQMIADSLHYLTQCEIKSCCENCPADHCPYVSRNTCT